MKKIFVLLILTSSNIFAADWTGDWLTNTTITSTSPTYFEGQKRGYVGAGSFQGRWRMNNDAIIGFNAPHIRSGCGGIDFFAGGLSFLDADYLVQKLQSIVQAAPAVAFDMALKTMCKECSETMKSMNDFAEELNAKASNSCQLSKQLVSNLDVFNPEKTGRVIGAASRGLDLAVGAVRNSFESQTNSEANGDKPNQSIQQAIASCPPEFKDIFTGGSVVQKMSARIGMTAYAGIIRGYIGDVNIQFDAVAKTYKVVQIKACRENKERRMDNILEGTVWERPAGINTPACVASTTQGVSIWAGTQITSISNKMLTSSTAITPAETIFMNNSPVPIYNILNAGIKNSTIEQTRSMIQDTVAKGYAHKMMIDMFDQIEYGTIIAQESVSKAEPAALADPNACNVEILGKAIVIVNNWKKEIQPIKRDIDREYKDSIEDLLNNLLLTKEMLAINGK